MWLNAPPEGVNEKYWLWGMSVSTANITRAECWESKLTVVTSVRPVRPCRFLFREKVNRRLVRLHRSVTSHSGVIPCSWHGKQPTMLTWPAYAELFPSACMNKKMQSRLKFNEECKKCLSARISNGLNYASRMFTSLAPRQGRLPNGCTADTGL